jgi:hypothetical protein
MKKNLGRALIALVVLTVLCLMVAIATEGKHWSWVFDGGYSHVSAEDMNMLATAGMVLSAIGVVMTAFVHQNTED